MKLQLWTITIFWRLKSSIHGPVFHSNDSNVKSPEGSFPPGVFTLDATGYSTSTQQLGVSAKGALVLGLK